MEFRIVGREKVTVPAGTFDAFLVVGQGFSNAGQNSTVISTKRWFAPEQSRQPIVAEETRRAGSGFQALDRRELVSFKQS